MCSPKKWEDTTCRWKRNSFAFARRWSSARGLAIGRFAGWGMDSPALLSNLACRPLARATAASVASPLGSGRQSPNLIDAMLPSQFQAASEIGPTWVRNERNVRQSSTGSPPVLAEM